MGDDTAAKTRHAETHAFQAEVAKILHLMVHSVYSDRDVFLRELISNASDACDKLRYLTVTEPDLIAGEPNFRIQVTIDKDKRRISVADNGIGMDEQELIDNLGTIARSGTSRFAESLSGDEARDAQLIGQFGVGFYSAFMVAERVEVLSRKITQEQAHLWSSRGEGTYEVRSAGNADALLDGRGTVVTLHLRKDADEFLDADRLKSIIKTYSDHIALPIYVAVTGREQEASEPVNTVGALWMRPKSEIGQEQYKEFYHHVGHVFDDPALTIHYRAEGRHEYAVLLFLPSTRPLDLFDPKRQTRVKLYVRRIFITDDAPLLPGYLRFMRGVIDSEDMPLNISREMLQNNAIVVNIARAVTKRVLAELKKLSEKDPGKYLSFWETFGPVLKEGIYEDAERRESLLELARFKTTKGEGWRTLADYVADMADKQTAIYYIHGEDAELIEKSPQLEGYRARGLEVLLLSDPVDAFWINAVMSYKDKPFRSVTQGADDLAGIPVKKDAGQADKAEKTEVSDAALGTLIALFKQTLEGKVADVRRSARLTDSPVCLVAGEGAMDLYLERILAQSQGPDAAKRDPFAEQILELNPDHELIRRLAQRAQADGVTPELEDAAHVLLDHARLLEGAPVSDPVGYTRRLAAIMARSFADATPSGDGQ